MNASIQVLLNQLNRSYSTLEHKGERLTKTQVKAILEYGLEKGYTNTNQFSDDEIDDILKEIC